MAQAVIMNNHTHTLERILQSENSGSLRSGNDPIQGSYSKEPTVGKRFQFIAEPLTGGSDARLIFTSTVEELFDGGFFTESGSIYKLTSIKNGI